MVWFVYGTGADINISLEQAGDLQIFGAGTHDCKLATADVDLLKLIQSAKTFEWSVFEPSVEEPTIDPLGRGLMKRYLANPTRPAAMINYHPAEKGDKAFISARFILPQGIFNTFRSMCQTILGDPRLGYLWRLGFDAMHISNTSQEEPTAPEFMNYDFQARRPYFSNEITFRICSVRK
jgi:hypothetical protein